MAWNGIVGRNFTPEEFRRYVAGLVWGSWRPSFIVLHCTVVPSLALRPQGINDGQIQAWVQWYRDYNGWSAGPHIFVDDRPDGIWVFTPLTTTGVHAKSWNSRTLGLEMLGDYDREEFNSGRGALVRDNAVAAIAILTDALGLDPDSMMGHRDYPGETKTCPGKKVGRWAIIQAVKDWLEKQIPPSPPLATGGEAAAPAARLLKLTWPRMAGDDVQEVLTRLQQRGYYRGQLDSLYGPLAVDAVRRFQADNGLQVDGLAGPLTLAALRK